jgi:glycosyltransferase involved in cell wall biosynthesis
LFGFVFYYYWFNGKRLLHGPVERMLRDQSIDFPFALMWANENWTRRWDGADSAVLISQDYRPEDDQDMLNDFVRHFRDKRYIRIGGRPLLIVYRPGLIPGAKETIARWRTICRENLNEDPLILMSQSFGDVDPTEFGLDGAVEFPPHKLCQKLRPINDQFELLDPEFEGQIHSYDAVAKASLDEPPPAFPLIKTVVPSWDNDARRQGSGLVINGSTPVKYQAWLAELIARARKAPVFNESLVLINAWNEWCEGAYLEPDLHFGAAYLNATGRAVAGISCENHSQWGILLVGHDAFPGGAQQLLHNIGRILSRRHGMRIEFLLLDGGILVDKYKALAPTKVLDTGVDVEAALAEYASRGFTTALMNTSVTAWIAPLLSAHGIAPELLLVHELPRILREKDAIASIRSGLRLARNVVFPAKVVASAVTELVGEAAVGNTLILSQGTYKTLSASAEQITEFLADLEINAGEALVLGVGYADMRKGFDLFLQTWRLMNRFQRVHFCWAGALAPELETWMAKEISAAKDTGTFHLTGNLENIAPAFGASIALVLTSREDPFPTVALEAMSMGKPVIAFSGSGGIPEMLSNTGMGYVVPYTDTVAMAEVLQRIIAEGEATEKVIARQAMIRDQYSFATYVSRLVSIALPKMPRISVTVPNYNYSRYMPERLASIFRQTHPVHEVLVLDDCSKDDSLDVIPRVAAEWGREILLAANKVNSGSVFEQWRKAAELSSGEWVWIAEADDSSSPDFLTRVMAVANNDSNVVLAFSDSSTITADGSLQWQNYKNYYATLEKNALTKSQIFEGSEFVSRYLCVKNLILNVSAVVWRRDALRRALESCGTKLRNYKMAGDWHLYLEALSTPGAMIAYESSPLNIHRRHEQSVTHALDVERHMAEIKQCHDFAREKYPNLATRCIEAQKAYLSEVTHQLGDRSGKKRRDSRPKAKAVRQK